MKVTKKVIEGALGNIGFSYGYEYSKRKTIIVREREWQKAIDALTKADVPHTILCVANSPCTGEISFKVDGK